MDEAYLIVLEGGVYQLCLPREQPIEDWEDEFIQTLKDSPDFLWLGNGKFIIGERPDTSSSVKEEWVKLQGNTIEKYV